VLFVVKNKRLNHEGHEGHEVKFDEISNKVKGIKSLFYKIFVCFVLFVVKNNSLTNRSMFTPSHGISDTVVPL